MRCRAFACDNMAVPMTGWCSFHTRNSGTVSGRFSSSKPNFSTPPRAGGPSPEYTALRDKVIKDMKAGGLEVMDLSAVEARILENMEDTK